MLLALKPRVLRALLASALLLTGECAIAGERINASGQFVAQDCVSGTTQDVVSMVAKAIKLVEAIGPIAAFRQFMTPGGGYLKGDLYVFVLDEHGTIFANGASPQSIGNNVRKIHDKDGNYFIESILEQAATHGSGWVNYRWINPCTGTLSPKSVYFEKTGKFTICVGLYNAVLTRNTVKEEFSRLASVWQGLIPT